MRGCVSGPLGNSGRDWFNPSIAHQVFMLARCYFSIFGFGGVPNTCQTADTPGGFIGKLRRSERTGKNRMVCTITMVGVKELESRELL